MPISKIICLSTHLSTHVCNVETERKKRQCLLAIGGEGPKVLPPEGPAKEKPLSADYQTPLMTACISRAQFEMRSQPASEVQDMLHGSMQLAAQRIEVHVAAICKVQCKLGHEGSGRIDRGRGSSFKGRKHHLPLGINDARKRI